MTMSRIDRQPRLRQWFFQHVGSRPRALVLAGLTLTLGCAAPRPAQIEAGPPMAEQLAHKALLSVIEEVEAANTLGDPQGLIEVRDRLVVLAGQPVVAVAVLYYAGYIDLSLASFMVHEDQELTSAVIAHGIAYLGAALERDPEHADCMAILSTLYMQRIEVDTLTAVSSYRESKDLIQRALALEPQNPRVVLLEGIRLLRLPGWLGGDRGRSIERMEAAIDLFAGSSPRDGIESTWGLADAFSWLGLALMVHGELDRSEAALASALELRPGYWWVTERLQPRLEGLRGE